MTIAGMIGEKGKPIPGTTLFDGAAAQKGYALNALCYPFNRAENRQAFLDDEEEYCARFALTPEQKEAVAERDVPGMIAAGGNICYLAKLAGIFKLNSGTLARCRPGFRSRRSGNACSIRHKEKANGRDRRRLFHQPRPRNRRRDPSR